MAVSSCVVSEFETNVGGGEGKLCLQVNTYRKQKCPFNYFSESLEPGAVRQPTGKASTA